MMGPAAAIDTDAGRVDQTALRNAISDPSMQVPAGLTDGAGRAAGRRFSVYRNNVTASLIEALECAFPVIARLVGGQFFRAMAAEFARAHPPRSPLIMLYGRDFPRFLESFGPVSHLPYLPDVARLEQARREAYHDADARPVDGSALALAPEDLAAARLSLAPSLRLVRSRFPIHSIWKANTSGGPKPVFAPEDVIVTRPALDPVVTLLPEGSEVLEALMAGATIEEAAAGEAESALAPLFAALVHGGAITAIEGVPS
jgi:hypothetical protein